MAKRPQGQGGDPVARSLQAAITALQSGAPGRAEELLRAALRLVPAHPVANHLLGLCLHERGETEAAVNAIERAIEVAPDYVDAVNNLGNILVQTGDLARAEDLFRRVIGLAPAFPAAHNNLGITLKRTGREPEALASFRTACELEPADPQLRRNLADTLRRTGDMKGAIEAYRSALALASDCDPDTYRHLATCYRHLGDVQNAIKTVRAWLERDATSAIARHTLASLGAEQAPARAEDAYVQTLFDSFAEEFDERLSSIDYRGPELVMEQVRQASRDRYERTLDAGCGTGLLGPLLRPMSTFLCGVDLSTKMLEKATRRGCYDALHERELTAFLRADSDPFDLVVCADTLCYFGVLDDVLTGLANASRPNALVVFTVEELREADVGYRINPQGRYAHTEAYVRRTMRAAGLEPLRIVRAPLRKELGEPVQALVVAAERRAL